MILKVLGILNFSMAPTNLLESCSWLPLWLTACHCMTPLLGSANPEATPKPQQCLSLRRHWWWSCCYYYCHYYYYPGLAQREEQGEWGAESEVAHKWARWLHNPCRLGVPTASKRGTLTKKNHVP